MLLIGWSKLSTNQKHYTVLGSDASSVWNLACPRLPYSPSPSPNACISLRSALPAILDFHFAGKPVVASGNIDFFPQALFTLCWIAHRLDVRYSVNSNGAELEQVVHTYRTARRNGWPRGVWWTKSHSSFRNIYFRLSGFQASFLLIHFRYSSNTCSHCTKCNTEPIRNVMLLFRDRRGASLRCRNRAEITVLICEQKHYKVWFSLRRKS